MDNRRGQPSLDWIGVVMDCRACGRTIRQHVPSEEKEGGARVRCRQCDRVNYTDEFRPVTEVYATASQEGEA